MWDSILFTIFCLAFIPPTLHQDSDACELWVAEPLDACSLHVRNASDTEDTCTGACPHSLRQYLDDYDSACRGVPDKTDEVKYDEFSRFYNASRILAFCEEDDNGEHCYKRLQKEYEEKEGDLYTSKTFEDDRIIRKSFWCEDCGSSYLQYMEESFQVFESLDSEDDEMRDFITQARQHADEECSIGSPDDSPVIANRAGNLRVTDWILNVAIITLALQ